MRVLAGLFVGSIPGLTAGPALAHSFGSSYALPIRFAIHAWGAALALAVSFAVLAAFASRTSLPTTAPTISSLALESRG